MYQGFKNISTQFECTTERSLEYYVKLIEFLRYKGLQQHIVHDHKHSILHPQSNCNCLSHKNKRHSCSVVLRDIGQIANIHLVIDALDKHHRVSFRCMKNK